jgi:hypothetical protein
MIRVECTAEFVRGFPYVIYVRKYLPTILYVYYSFRIILQASPNEPLN